MDHVFAALQEDNDEEEEEANSAINPEDIVVDDAELMNLTLEDLMEEAEEEVTVPETSAQSEGEVLDLFEPMEDL